MGVSIEPGSNRRAVKGMCLLVLWACAMLATGQPTDKAGGLRVLQFPADRPMGEVFMRDAGLEATAGYFVDSPQSNTWDFVGPARGDVGIPAGKQVWLSVFHPAALKNLSPLARLGPNDLCVLTVDGRADPRIEAGRTILPHLAGLRGLQAFSLTNATLDRGALQALQRFSSLEALELHSAQLSDATLSALAGLQSLRELRLSGPAISDAGLSQLQKISSLAELRLSCPNVRGPGLAHLAKAPALRRLHLTGSGVTDAGLQYLRNNASLQELSLAKMTITDAGLAHLSGLVQLQALDLDKTKTTDRGLAHLKQLRLLRRLHLGGVTDAGMPIVGQFQALESLGVSPFITARGFAAIAGLPNLKTLDVAFLGRSPIDDRAVEQIARPRTLETLKLCGRGITDAGIARIAQLTNLKHLSLYSMPEVSDRGVARLAALESLRTLYLARTKATVAGLAPLASLAQLKSLHVVNIKPAATGLPALPSLESLIIENLGNAAIRDQDLARVAPLNGLKRLETSPFKGLSDKGMSHLAGLTALEYLAIGSPEITDAGLANLAGMNQLRYLEIRGDITDRGLSHLTNFPALSELKIQSESACSRAAIEQLRSRLPNLYALQVAP